MRSLTGLSARQEQRYMERQTERLARRVERSLRQELMTAYQAFSEDPIEAMNDHKERLSGIITREYNMAFDQFGQRAMDGAGKYYAHRLERKFIPGTETFDAARRAWILTWGARKVTQISNTTKEQAESVIQAATAATVGQGERAIANAIREALAEYGARITPSRSRTIARTEAHNAANAATMEAARALELPTVKEWSSADRERTREDHIDADRQRVALNDAFIVGGEALMHPGDPAGSAENIIECRCAMIVLVADE